MTLSLNRSPETVTTIADILDLPERVHRGDFVLRLTEVVERAEQTLGDYVVTEQLARIQVRQRGSRRCRSRSRKLVGQRLGETAGALGALLAGGIASGHAGELLPICLVCDVLFSDECDTLNPVLVQAAARLEPLHGVRRTGGWSVRQAVRPETVTAKPAVRIHPRPANGSHSAPWC